MALTPSVMTGLGTAAPDFKLPDVTTGKMVGPPQGTPLLVMFICNHCPYVKAVIGRLVEDVIKTSDAQIGLRGVSSADAVLRHPDRLVGMSELLTHQLRQLATYLREEVYYHPEKLVMEQKACRIIRGLFDAFVSEPRLLPRPVQERLDGADRHRVVCDFVSGLTDRSALDLYNRLFETYEFGFGGGTTP